MLPYSAISLGWGWSSYPYTYGGLNNIVGNHIHDHMRVLGDGGAIYTLGAQGNLPFEMPAKYKNISKILAPYGTSLPRYSPLPTTFSIMMG